MKNENKKMNMIERMIIKLISKSFDIEKLIKNQIEYEMNQIDIEQLIENNISNVIENQMSNEIDIDELITQHINEIDIDELIKNVIRENETTTREIK